MRLTCSSMCFYPNREPAMQTVPDYDYAHAATVADYLDTEFKIRPDAAIFTGTGLGEVAASMRVERTLQFSDIPQFPTPTAASHRGRLLVGEMAGKTVYLFQGRMHLYEGYSPRAVTFPIRVLQMLGVKTLVLTNASGGINPRYSAGDIMIIQDHINLTGANPLAGPNEDRWGQRFPEMIDAYASTLRTLASTEAGAVGIPVQSGVYAGLYGPSLETPAEMRFLRTIGADAVGFSTVMETIAGIHAGMHVLGLSVITNLCRPDAPVSADVQEIIATAQKAAPRIGAVLCGVLTAMDR